MYINKMSSNAECISVEPEQDANSALTELDKGTKHSNFKNLT